MYLQITYGVDRNSYSKVESVRLNCRQGLYQTRSGVSNTLQYRERINICLRCGHTHALYPCNSRLIDCTYTYLLHHCEIPRVMQNANDGLEWGCGTRPTAPLSLPLLYITYVHYEQQFFAFLSRYYFFTLSYSFFQSMAISGFSNFLMQTV